MKNLFFELNPTSKSAWVGLLLSSFLLTTSCKENTILPSDLVPLVDNINTFQQDTFTVITSTVYKDSLLTGGKLNNTNRAGDPDFAHMIGTISNDAVYGKTVGSSYIQVRPPAPSFSFSGTNQIIDSVILAINFLGSYGDTISAPNQFFSLYRTTDNLSKDSAYYESNDVTISSQQLLDAQQVNFNTLAKDSPVVNGVTLRPQLRFKLPVPFRDSILAQQNTNTFASYASFLDWLGGFFVLPDSTAGSTLGYFDTDNTSMYVYYRYTNNGSPDTTTAVFPFDATYCNRFNRITRNYSGKFCEPFIGNTIPQGDSIIFVESEPGMASLISFPHIGQFPNAVINKAELILTVISPITNYSDTVAYNIPNQIQMLYVDENGEDQVLEDYLLLGSQRVGGFRGFYELAGLQRIQYKFNISHTIQKAVTTQNSNFALKLSAVRGNFPARGRVMLRGSGSAVALEKPKLNIIFTKIQR